MLKCLGKIPIFRHKSHIFNNLICQLFLNDNLNIYYFLFKFEYNMASHRNNCSSVTYFVPTLIIENELNTVAIMIKKEWHTSILFYITLYYLPDNLV